MPRTTASRPLVPPWLDRAAALTLRGLIVAAGVLLLLNLLWRLKVVLIPVVVALLLSTVLGPPAARLRSAGWPPLLAAFTVFAAALVVFVGIGWVIVPRFVDQFGGVADSVSRSVDEAESWLTDGPLHLSDREVGDLVDSARAQLTANKEELAAGAVNTLMLVVQLVIGGFVSLLLTFFFIKDADRLTAALLSVVPRRWRAEAHELGARMWQAVSSYVRGISMEALIESGMKAVGLWILGVPLVLPLATITFFAGFVPLVGAVSAGMLAAMVALVAKGPATALATIVLALFIQNVASHLLDPLIMSRATRLHPIVVVLALSTGGVLAGLFGAVIAVPVAAAVTAAVAFYRDRSDDLDEPGVDAAVDGDPPPAADTPHLRPVIVLGETLLPGTPAPATGSTEAPAGSSGRNG